MSVPSRDNKQVMVTISVMLIARFFSSGWLLATLKVLGTANRRDGRFFCYP